MWKLIIRTGKTRDFCATRFFCEQSHFHEIDYFWKHQTSNSMPRHGGLQIPRWLGSDPLSAWWLGLAPATLEFWVRFPNERNQGKQAHPVLKYRVPHGSQCVTSGLIHTGFGSSSIIAHVVHSPPPPPANSFVIGPAVINTHTPFCNTHYL